MTPDTTIEDKPFKLGDWQPQNYDRTFRGTVSMRQTAINSLNTYYSFSRKIIYR